jgi:phage baseplate assembly protein W
MPDTPRSNARPLVGWPLLPLPDEHGNLRWPDLARSVREGVRVILSTRPGEQLMRTEFGGGLDRLLHEPNTIATRQRLHDLVQDSLTKWEPRILLDGVDVQEVADAPDQVRIAIAYRLARTGAAGAVNVTVELEG